MTPDQPTRVGGNMTDSNAVDQLTEAQKKENEKIRKEAIDDVQKAIKKAYESGRRSLWDQVCLGKSLIRARNSLKGAFYDVINDKIINKRQVQRLIGLVIDSSSQKEFSDGTTKNNLKIDTQIDALTEASFKNLKDPSMQKLKTLKTYEKSDFIKVMSGDDTKYYEEKTKAKFTAPKGVTMTEDEYSAYKKKGSKTLIGELFNAEKTIDSLEEKLKKAESETRKQIRAVDSKETQLVDMDSEIEQLKNQIEELKVELGEREPVAA